MQLSSDVIGLKVLVPGAQISQMTEPAFLKSCPKMTKVSSIEIELKLSRGTFSSIAIKLKIDGQRALKLCVVYSQNFKDTFV